MHGREKLFDNIKRGPLQVPRDMPQDALDLIVKLLNRDPRTRLGSGPEDAEEIKRHPFFSGINWDDVRTRKLKLPRPRVKPPVCDGCSFDGLGEEETGREEGRMHRWTFVANDFMQ